MLLSGNASQWIEWQQNIGERELDPNLDLGPEDYGARADIILAALEEETSDKT